MWKLLKSFKLSWLLSVIASLTSHFASGQESTLFSIQDNLGQGSVVAYDDWNGFELKYSDSFNNGLWSISHIIDVGDSDIIAIGNYHWDSSYCILKYSGTLDQWNTLHEFDTTEKLRFGSKIFKRKTGEIVGVLFVDKPNTSISPSIIVFQMDPSSHQYEQLAYVPSDSISAVSLDFAFNENDELIYGNSTWKGKDNQGFIFSIDLKNGEFKHVFDVSEFGLSKVGVRSLQYSNKHGLIGALTNSNDYGVLFKYYENEFSILQEYKTNERRKIGGIQIGDSIIAGMFHDPVSEKAFLFYCDTGGGNLDSMECPWELYSNYNLEIIGDSQVYILTSTGGSHEAGMLTCYNLQKRELRTVQYFSNQTGGNPQSYLYKPGIGFLINQTKGGGGSLGGIYYYSPAGPNALKALRAPQFGSNISSRIITLKGYSKLVITNNTGGLFGKGSIVFLNLPGFKQDTVIFLGSDDLTKDSLLSGPIGASLMKLNDSSFVVICESGGQHGLGGVINFQQNQDKWQSQEFHYQAPSESKLVGSCVKDEFGKVYFWSRSETIDYVLNTLHQWDITNNIVKPVYTFNDYIVSGIPERAGVIQNNTYYTISNTYLDPFTFNRLEGSLVTINLNTGEIKGIKIPLNYAGYDYGNSVILMQDSLLAFTASNDYKFGFGTLIIYSLNSGQFSFYEFNHFDFGIKPTGELYFAESESKIVILCSRNGAYNEGAIMEFDLANYNWNKAADLEPGFGKELIFNHNPRVLRLPSNLLGVNKPVHQDNINLYPNPATQFIKLTQFTPNESFQIISSSGVSVRKGIMDENGQISLLDLPSGFYFIRLNQSHASLKFIKQ